MLYLPETSSVGLETTERPLRIPCGMAVTKVNTYTIKFADKTVPDKSLQADDFTFPESEWEHVIFYTGPERNETVVYTAAIGQIFSISVQAASD
jgi:hypothetical protein